MSHPTDRVCSVLSPINIAACHDLVGSLRVSHLQKAKLEKRIVHTSGFPWPDCLCQSSPLEYVRMTVCSSEFLLLYSGECLCCSLLLEGHIVGIIYNLQSPNHCSAGHYHLCQNYANSISVVGSCAFVQTGVIGQCGRDGYHQSRIIRGDTLYCLPTIPSSRAWIKFQGNSLG